MSAPYPGPPRSAAAPARSRSNLIGQSINETASAKHTSNPAQPSRILDHKATLAPGTVATAKVYIDRLRQTSPSHWRKATTPWDVDPRPAHNYNELEWVGDAIVRIAATMLLHSKSELTTSLRNETRDILICGKTLSIFTDGLDLLSHVPPVPVGRSRTIKIKPDIFEGIVGAIAEAISLDEAVRFCRICMEGVFEEAAVQANLRRDRDAISRAAKRATSGEKLGWLDDIDAGLREAMKANMGVAGEAEMNREQVIAAMGLNVNRARAYVEKSCARRGLSLTTKLVRSVPKTETDPGSRVMGIYVNHALVGEGMDRREGGAMKKAFVNSAAGLRLLWLREGPVADEIGVKERKVAENASDRLVGEIDSSELGDADGLEETRATKGEREQLKRKRLPSAEDVDIEAMSETGNQGDRLGGQVEVSGLSGATHLEELGDTEEGRDQSKRQRTSADRYQHAPQSQ